MKKKVTIIGGGNGGLTGAYHFTKIGVDVCLYDLEEFSYNISHVMRRGNEIEALKDIEGVDESLIGREKVDIITTNIEKALLYSKIIVMIIPSYAQETMFEKMYPYLDRHTIISMPGNFASLVLNKRLLELGDNKNTTFVDATTIPWACRIESEGGVAIYGTKRYLPIGVFPAKKGKEVLKLLAPLFVLPLKLLDNVIMAGMENINFGGHPLLSLLNMGIMENFDGNFNYYRDTCSIATSRAVEVMEGERIKVGKSLSLNLTPELQAMNSLYGTKYRSVYELNRASSAHSQIKAPNTSQHRYVTEDIPYLIVPCCSLGSLLSIPTPMMFSCITIAGAYNGEDYFSSGRNIKALGLEGMDKNEILNYITNG